MRKLFFKIKSLFGKKLLSENIALLFIAIIITASMSSLVNKQVDTIHSHELKTVSITFLPEKNPDSEGYDICIIDNSSNSPNDIFSYIMQSLSNTNIEYQLVKKENKNDQDKLLLDGKANSNKVLSFQCPYFSNSSIDMISSPRSGKIQIDCEDFSRQYDLYNAGKQGRIRCTPICESYQHLVPYIIIYFFIFILAVLTVYFLKDVVLHKILNGYSLYKNSKLMQYNMKIDFFILFILLSAFSLTQYFSGNVPGHLQMGDQNGYWNQISALSSIDDFKSIPDFRGYLCYLVPAIFRSIEFHAGISAFALWIVYLNFLAAILFGITFPMLSRKFYSAEITRPQVYLSAIIMCFFLRGLLIYTLIDFPAAVFFLSGFTLFLYFLDNPGWVKGLLCGICFSIAANLKVNYQFVVIFAVISWSIYYIVQKKKCKNCSIKSLVNRKMIVGILGTLLGFLLICIPELLINLSKGVFSFTPFQTETSWNDKNYMIEELAASKCFNNMRLYPSASKADLQVQNIKIDYIGDTATLLNYQQLFEMFIRKPLDTLVYIAKKIFIGFNTLNPFVYAGETYTAYKDSTVWLSCLINYFIIFSSIFVVFRKSKKVEGKLFLLINFVFAVLPSTFVHVEWRAYIIGYLLINFFFCYRFLPAVTDTTNSLLRSQAHKNSYYKRLIFFLAAMIIICSTIT